jgi:hypothetical protein
MKLRKVNTGETEMKQIDIQVKVKSETIKAIVDCGANVDYVNEEWCEKKGFPMKEIGQGWMEGYDGERKRVKLQEAEIKFRFQGAFFRQKFRVVRATGTDILVLGMPWLQRNNPDIDWKKRKVTLKRKASKEMSGTDETPTEQGNIAKKVNTETEPTQRQRGGYDVTGVSERKLKEQAMEDEYQQRLQETKDKLPDELKEYAEVFCQKK